MHLIRRLQYQPTNQALVWPGRKWKSRPTSTKRTHSREVARDPECWSRRRQDSTYFWTRIQSRRKQFVKNCSRAWSHFSFSAVTGSYVTESHLSSHESRRKPFKSESNQNHLKLFRVESASNHHWGRFVFWIWTWIGFWNKAVGSDLWKHKSVISAKVPKWKYEADLHHHECKYYIKSRRCFQCIVSTTPLGDIVKTENLHQY